MCHIVEASLAKLLESIARGEVDADTARAEIFEHLGESQDFSSVYSALLRWTWVAMAERRADNDMRRWHRLLRDVAARTSLLTDSTRAVKVGAQETAERLKALSDLLRISVGMQDRPDRARLLTRAHVPEILQYLLDNKSEAVARSDLQSALGLKTANLSRILTLLVLEGLVDRLPSGRKACFLITAQGERCLIDHQANLTDMQVDAESPEAEIPKAAQSDPTNITSIDADFMAFLKEFLAKYGSSSEEMLFGTPERGPNRLTGHIRGRVASVIDSDYCTSSAWNKGPVTRAVTGLGPARNVMELYYGLDELPGGCVKLSAGEPKMYSPVSPEAEYTPSKSFVPSFVKPHLK